MGKYFKSMRDEFKKKKKKLAEKEEFYVLKMSTSNI